MAIVTISRQFGSGGNEIARRVCESLGYTLFNKKMIDDAAVQAGLTPQDAMDLSEENYKVSGFLDRLFSGMATADLMAFGSGAEIAYMPPQEYFVDEAMALSLVKRAVLSSCRMDNMVILGRGGQVLLQDQLNVLHVRVQAPLEVRVHRVEQDLRGTPAYSGKSDTEVHRQARSLIQQRDSASRDYIHRYYEADWDDPLLYHVVLNTGRLTLDQSVQLIVELAKQLQPA